MTSILNVNEEEFRKQVSESDVLVLVDFWAEWCGPCKAIAPILENLQREFTEKIKIVKVNIDENSSLSEEYKIMSIPSLIAFKDGVRVGDIVGVSSPVVFRDFINKMLGAK